MIQNYDKFWKWNAKFGKIYTLLKIIFIQKWLTKNIWSIGVAICIFNNKLQNISFKNSFIWKSEKKLKMTHILFVNNPIGSFACTWNHLPYAPSEALHPWLSLTSFFLLELLSFLSPSKLPTQLVMSSHLKEKYIQW